MKTYSSTYPGAVQVNFPATRVNTPPHRCWLDRSRRGQFGHGGWPVGNPPTLVASCPPVWRTVRHGMTWRREGRHTLMPRPAAGRVQEISAPRPTEVKTRAAHLPRAPTTKSPADPATSAPSFAAIRDSIGARRAATSVTELSQTTS